MILRASSARARSMIHGAKTYSISISLFCRRLPEVASTTRRPCGPCQHERARRWRKLSMRRREASDGARWHRTCPGSGRIRGLGRSDRWPVSSPRRAGPAIAAMRPSRQDPWPGRRGEPARRPRRPSSPIARARLMSQRICFHSPVRRQRALGSGDRLAAIVELAGRAEGQPGVLRPTRRASCSCSGVTPKGGSPFSSARSTARWVCGPMARRSG